MKSNYTISLAFLAVITSFVLYISCQASVKNTKEQFTSFTNKPWKLQELSVSPAIDWDLDGKKETNILAILENCEKDDLLVFKSDNIVVRNAGKIKCDEDDDQEKQTGVWSYNKVSKKLVLKEDGKAQELAIVELSNNRFVLTYNWSATNGQAHKMTAVYTVK